MTDLINQKHVDFPQVENDIRAILKRPGYDNGNIGPVLIRLAWHAAGTYSKHDNSGGSNGATMRFAPESTDEANAGLDVARSFLEPIKQKHPLISYADLWTLAGVVSIESLGGPRVPWFPGRTDVSLANSADATSDAATGCPVMAMIPPNGRLPDAALDATHLRHIFYRMGFNDRDIVALSGAHTLGMCHTDRSGYDGVWTHHPNTFSNQFYKVLIDLKWHKRDWDDWTGPEQYTDDSEELMMLPTDMALIWDPQFRVIVAEYATNQDKFFSDFSDAFARLLELGVCRLLPLSSRL
ncbi:heme peroxidase [Obelidium mucronatum]|nr:heme peroxidase [Obelidium mucronatum]